MTDVLRGKDCQPLDDKQLDADDRAWLRRLVSAVDAGSLIVALHERRGEDEPIVSCERDGRWYCGRYVGTVAFENRRLVIAPRFGPETLGSWLAMALGLRVTETTGELVSHEAFLPQLLARVWSTALVRAARHGPPALRADRPHLGQVVRGRLDVRATVRHQTRGRSGVASVMRARSLDNTVSRTLVAAHEVLRRQLGRRTLQALMPEQAQDLMDLLNHALPTPVAVPSPSELARVRLTPITESYRPAMLLSLAIARHRGLFSESTPDGQASGVLLDMAELWELFVVACLRLALPEGDVVHGTQDAQGQGHLLTNARGLVVGRLMPDVLLQMDGQVRVADAKYKSLHPRASRPQGVEREDLYQMSAYLSRWGGERGAGYLLFPREDGDVPMLVREGPWSFHAGQQLHLLTVPRGSIDAVEYLRQAMTTVDLPLESPEPVWLSEI